MRYAPEQPASDATGHFNPRTPLQSAMDELDVDKLHDRAISIHALHYRVRYNAWLPVAVDSSYFNPRTPLQSAIPLLFRVKSRVFHFNPRTPLQSAIPEVALNV